MILQLKEGSGKVYEKITFGTSKENKVVLERGETVFYQASGGHLNLFSGVLPASAAAFMKTANQAWMGYSLDSVVVKGKWIQSPSSWGNAFLNVLFIGEGVNNGGEIIVFDDEHDIHQNRSLIHYHLSQVDDLPITLEFAVSIWHKAIALNLIWEHDTLMGVYCMSKDSALPQYDDRGQYTRPGWLEKLLVETMNGENK